ncbi:DUF3566 domain-containing protein [Leekyejoonella antrihumi]|uniref:DUF3566 domain-containing protein n=1 Tax=Leekyejoonella antrihumi TaxID=1660198 RepID=A0A563E757_9MICO|nr:DUF3566 domain-containing protein [Leekyejoonella antrihumi]
MPRGASGGGPAQRGARPTAPRPAAPTKGSARAATRPPRATPRRVRLTLSRVDPWSVMLNAFLLSVAIALAMVVVVAVLWIVLAGMGVFDNLNGVLRTLDRKGSSFNLMDYIGFGRVISLSVVIGFIDIILMTALATLGAFLYNICSSLVGGIRLTLSDD